MNFAVHKKPLYKITCGVVHVLNLLRLHFAMILPQHLPTHQHLMLFIPQAEEQRFEAGAERQRLDLERRILVMTLLQFIVRDLRAQVMDVMITNIAGEPLQHLGQFIE